MSGKRTIKEMLKPRPLVAVGANDTVLSACKMMRENKCGSVLVMDGAALQGIFTERDVVMRVVGAERDPATTVMADVMTAKPKTVDASLSTLHALMMMDENTFRHLPVVSNGQVVGVLSRRDFAGEERVWLEQMKVENSRRWERM